MLQAKEYTYKTVEGDPMHARIYTLDNGLTVYLSQNKEKPEIQTYIAVRAGAQNDPLESTGLAHYQEHIMFKGTKSYGTTDYERELPNLRAIDSLYEVYGHTVDAAQRKAIYHLIDSFSYESSKIAIANEFDKLMSAIGATGVNAYTSTDRTCYHEVIPSNELTRWAMIESDRFQNLVIRGFHTELETVYEEFNMNSTRDVRKVLLAVDQALYPSVPYRQHTVLGTQEHLKNPSLVNMRRFYNTYYRPNNVAVCLAGDFEYDHAIEVIDAWFGNWKPQPIPAPASYNQAALKAHKDTTVFGNEAPEVWLAWMMPNAKHEDYDALNVMGKVLRNGKCGLLDVDIDQRQQLLYSYSMLWGGSDYSTFLLFGAPKENQTMEDVRTLLLAEIDKLKKGDFSEDMLRAIIKNTRRNELIALQENENRAEQFVEAHIMQIPYEDIVHEIDRAEKVTKDDIIRVANKYFTDSYVCVLKQHHEDANPPKMDKPQITPIEMNREASSAFYKQINTIYGEPTTPQFLDFEKDLSRTVLPGGVELLYCRNNDNELTKLTFIVRKGTDQEPELDFATNLLNYLGTGSLSTEEYQTQLYQQAAEAWTYSATNSTSIGLFGLGETVRPALALLEDHVLTAQPDDAILAELISDRIKEHNDAKQDQDACFQYLWEYGTKGAEAAKLHNMTPKQMAQLRADDLLRRVRDLLPAIERVEYYGPLAEDEVKALLTSSKMLAMADPAKRIEPKRIKPLQIDKTDVLIAPYKANNICMRSYANWGETYNPRDLALIQLFNEYFGGSMGSIVFQEMRESRALCYTSYAGFGTPNYKDDNYYFIRHIKSQNDKLKECILTFDTICDFMPVSPEAFAIAKAAVIKQIEQRRYTRSEPIDSYVAFRQLGWEKDLYEDIYQEVKKLTLDDIIAFQQQHVAKRTYRYMILGDSKDLDLKFLKTLGPVKMLSLKDIFVY